MKITETMLLNDILEIDPDLTDIFLRHGLNCVGCPAARTENLKEAADGHGIDLVLLLDDLNNFLMDK